MPLVIVLSVVWIFLVYTINRRLQEDLKISEMWRETWQKEVKRMDRLDVAHRFTIMRLTEMLNAAECGGHKKKGKSKC